MPKKRKKKTQSQKSAEKKRMEKRDFFLYVRAIQNDRVPEQFATGKALRAAKSIDPEDVKTMLNKKLKPKDECIQRVVEVLKEMVHGSSILGEDQDNVVADTFTKQGDFDMIVKQFRGVQLTPKEKSAAMNFDIDLTEGVTPEVNDFGVTVKTSDDFGNNTTAVVKKLQQGNKFVWVAFLDNSNANDDEMPDQMAEDAMQSFDPPPVAKPTDNSRGNIEPEDPDAELPGEDKVVIKKSIEFADDTEGADILIKFLNQMDQQ